MPHICFAGFAPTVGDTAIGQSLLQGLKAHTGLPVRIYADRSEVFRMLPEVGDGDEVRGKLPSVPLPTGRLPSFASRHRRLLDDLRSAGGANLLPPKLFATLSDMFAGCAALVFQGGPHWNWMTRRKALHRLYLIEAARHYGTRVYHVGVSCGPFDRAWPRRLWMDPLFRRTLDRHDILFVRDAFSGPELNRLGVSTRVVESTDAAVFLGSYPDDRFADLERRIRGGSDRPRLGVCVRDFQPRYAEAVRARGPAFRELAATLDYVLEHLADVFFLGTDHSAKPGKKTDLEVARDVRRLMTSAGAEILDVDVWNPSVLKHTYGSFDAMVSMRLHPTILALGSGVPCLVLSYDAKCDDFFERLGLREFAVPLADFRSGPAIAKVGRLLGEPDLRHDIRAAYDRLKDAHAKDYEPMYRQIRGRAAEVEGVLRPGRRPASARPSTTERSHIPTGPVNQ